MSMVAGIILLSAAVGAGSGAGVATLLDNGNSASNAPVATISQPVSNSNSGASVAKTTNVSASGQPASVADLYTVLRPSVVKIDAVSSRSGSGGTGSGIVLDDQGHIITNYHVVQGFDKISVSLSDGSSRTANVVGSDPGDDLAVVQIDTSGLKLTPVKMGDSSQTRIGDTVLAIGNPLDLEATLTEGIVSGEGRVLSGSANARPLRELIQTDTAINPGNSGGGLFNLNGELIGITNAIENPTGQESFAGIGYAIPVSTVQSSLPAMLAGQSVSHARLGVSLEDVSPALADSMGLNVTQGVLVQQVEAGSGAANAGLQASTRSGPGDVITGIDGHDVKTFDDLANYLDGKKAGDQVTLNIVRNGKQMNLSVTLDAWTQ
jgi:S1-C subfamily serine protease